MMELRDFFNLLSRSARVILVSALLGITCGWLVGTLRPTFSTATVSLVRDGVIEKNAAPSLQYDGYYLVETSRLFGERLGNVLRDASVRASNPSPGNSLPIRRVERLTSGDYKIKVEGIPQDAQQDVHALEQSLSDQLRNQAESTGEYANFKAHVSSFIEEPHMPLWHYMGAGLLLGLAAGILLVLFRHYLSGSQYSLREGEEL